MKIMILRRTEIEYKIRVSTWKNLPFDIESHTVIRRRVTWWLLFIPIFYHESIIKTSI